MLMKDYQEVIMPDIVTHATFAKDLSERLNNEKLKEMLNKNQYIYYLGAQGPDAFYFYKLFSLKKDPEFNNFGNVMHDVKVGPFLIESICYLKENYSDELYSYICGFICHHALDRNVHPYVYYVTGKDNMQYRGNHVRLERAIDSWFIINKWDTKKPHRFKIYQKIFGYQLDKNIFVSYYNNILNKVYQKENGGEVFLNSVKYFKKYSKLIYDHFGFKKKFFHIIDKTINKKSKIVLETLCYYDNIDKTIDYLNINKKEWLHPVVKEMTSTESFLELYEKGISEALDEIGIINMYLENIRTVEDLKTKIKDLSYSTGLPCIKQDKMINFNVIFK